MTDLPVHTLERARFGLTLLCLVAAGVVFGFLSPDPSRSGETSRVDDALREVDATIARGPFQPNWPSLEKYQVPEWYLDAKFGIFIHWGVYSVPAFDNEWYPRNMYKRDEAAYKHHLEKYGPQSQFGYKDFIPRFKAERFDARAWAELFKKSGARYVVPVAEHHDGFPMYDCSFTEWSAAKMGPQRDVVGELARAVGEQGMHFGASSHRAEHWWFFDQGRLFDSDVKDPRYAGLYGPAEPEKTQPNKAYLNDWLARTCEIVDKYQPELIWFDWWIEQPAFEAYKQKFAAFYYNRGAEWKRGVAINYKKEAFPERAAVLDIERGKLDKLRPLFWQTDTSVSTKSWGYIETDTFRAPDSLIDDLVDIVSKNGCLLLNVGPRPDGTIPEEVQKILLEIGGWLAVNGDAIYGTRPWKISGEGPTEVVGGSFKDTAGKSFTAQDIRFTTRANKLYAVVLAWPQTGRVNIHSLAAGAPHAPRNIESLRLLGSNSSLKWTQSAEGLTVELPPQKPCDYAFAVEIALSR
jgi:alpha-L-fucosidase